jgi:hypothetical protein
MLYVDPLGKVTEISYANNHINKLRNNTMLYEERLKSVQKNTNSNNIFFSIYSVVAVIFILMVLTLLRKLQI